MAAHDGHWFKTVGDAIQVAFADPLQAVLAALAGQRGLAQADWGRTSPLLVRMGIHLLYEPVIASLQSRLGGTVFYEAWAEGRALTMEQAIEYALEVKES